MSVPPVDLNVPDDVRLRLTHGCLELIARRAGVRALHIKGVALHPRLAAGRAPSTDCDLLVDPAGVGACAASLIDGGWEARTRFEHGSVFGHAATYYHPRWGTVDLHRAFPGLDVGAQRAFELLWDRRERIGLGSVDCAVPDLLAQRLILLVHAARDATGRRGHDVGVAWEELDAEQRAQVEDLAAQLGARVPLAFATGRPDAASGLPGEHLWAALHRDADPTTVWRARLRDARGRSVRETMRVLVSALRVNPDHLELRLGRAPTRREMRQEWWRRWGRALRRWRGTDD
ncbi:MAG: nucleotidyltransferase family protein [Brachybacterium sp.]|nr:nucleotidyltransferase family protein [Brachybacterium sp.]